MSISRSTRTRIGPEPDDVVARTTPAAGSEYASRPGPSPSVPACGHVTEGEVAVIVPARNEEDNIERCLSAVKKALSAAGLEGAQLVVVDDESSDRTSELAESLGASVLHQRPRGGPLAAWARGVGATDAAFLFFVDADCVVDPDAVSLLLAGLCRPGVGVAAARAVPADSPSGKVIAGSGRFSGLFLHEVRCRIGSNDFVPIGRLMAVRRDAWHISADDLSWPCDRTVAKLAKEAGWQISYVPEARVVYELPGTYTALRSDYERTQVARRRLNISYDPVPKSALVSAGLASFRRAPVDGTRWLVARIMLTTERASGRFRAGFDYWNPDPSQLRDSPASRLSRLVRRLRRRPRA